MCLCERCRTRKLMGPAILVTLGVLFLLDNAGHIGFDRTWPAILLVIGIVKLMQSNASSEGHTRSTAALAGLPPTGFPPTPPAGFPPTPPPGAPPVHDSVRAAPDPEPTASSGEVKNV